MRAARLVLLMFVVVSFAACKKGGGYVKTAPSPLCCSERLFIDRKNSLTLKEVVARVAFLHSGAPNTPKECS